MKQVIHRDLEHLANITQFVSNVYQINSKPSTKIYNLCKNNSRICQLILTVILMGYCVLMTCYVVPSYTKIILTGNYTPTFNLYIPYFDHKIVLSALVVEMYNFMCEIVAILSVVPFDGLAYVVLASLTMISTIITEDLSEFERFLKEQHATEREANQRMIKIILMHREYDK